MNVFLSLCLAVALLLSVASPAHAQFGLFGGGDDDEFEIDVDDGEIAVLTTSLTVEQTNSVVRNYFNNLNVDYETNLETGWLNTVWYGERRAFSFIGGVKEQEQRSSVRVLSADEGAEVHVQVFERLSRPLTFGGGAQNERSESKGDWTEDVAEELKAALVEAEENPEVLVSITPPPSIPEVDARFLSSAEPETVTLEGKTPSEVEELLGNPERVVNLGDANQVFVYPFTRVLFVDGIATVATVDD